MSNYSQFISSTSGYSGTSGTSGRSGYSGVGSSGISGFSGWSGQAGIGGAAFSGALVVRNSTQTIGAAAWTTVTCFGSVTYDTSNFRVTANRFTIPAGVTRVQLFASVAGVSNTSQWIARIIKNGDAANSLSTSTDVESVGVDTAGAFTPVLSVVAGDYFELQVFSDTSRSIYVDPTADYTNWFSIQVADGASGFSGYSGVGTSGISGYSGTSGVSGYSGFGLPQNKSSYNSVYETIVNADNVQIRVDSVNKRPQLRANTTTFTAAWSGIANISGQTNALNFAASATSITTSAWVDMATTSISTEGDSYTILLQNTTAGKLYRVICTTGSSGATITVETLL